MGSDIQPGLDCNSDWYGGGISKCYAGELTNAMAAEAATAWQADAMYSIRQ